MRTTLFIFPASGISQSGNRVIIHYKLQTVVMYYTTPLAPNNLKEKPTIAKTFNIIIPNPHRPSELNAKYFIRPPNVHVRKYL